MWPSLGGPHCAGRTDFNKLSGAGEGLFQSRPQARVVIEGIWEFLRLGPPIVDLGLKGCRLLFHLSDPGGQLEKVIVPSSEGVCLLIRRVCKLCCSVDLDAFLCSL